MKQVLSWITTLFLVGVLAACQVEEISSPAEEKQPNIDTETLSLLMVAGDQCNYTSQCKAEYGDTATDCLNSRSDTSVCMCGEERCDAPPPFTPVPPAGDECNLTSECKALYGDQANDCADSRSDSSICMCGTTECYKIDPGNGGGDNGGGQDNPDDANNCSVLEATAFDQYSGIPGFTNATVDTKLGVSVLQIADRLKTAAAIETYTGASADVIFRLNAMQEYDGEPTYVLKVNGSEVGKATNTRTFGTSTPEYSLEKHQVNSTFFALKSGDTIQLEFSNVTNGLVPEGETTATARGRWASLEVCTVGDNNGGDNGGGDNGGSDLPNEPPVTNPGNGNCKIGGELNQFQRVELVCEGVAGNENTAATFTDHRFDVTFSKGGESFKVPGHFAADGRAADTGASSGNRWRAYFMPPSAGNWNYAVSFRQGSNIAISTNVNAGTPVTPFNGKTGTFSVAGVTASLPDMRARGLLQHDSSERYMRFSGDNTVFVEGGMDSPENIFGYSEFDNTTKHFDAGSCKGILHDFALHKNDWKAGDPTWKNGKGKALIGLLNYISNQGVNAVYVMANTVRGDGCDAHPWAKYNQSGNEKTFDVSKLDQWERAFRHMERNGMLVHMMTQETENDQLLNGGALGLERKLYYRELISRFAHHPALQWNLGEENTNTVAQQKAYSNFIKQFDPYDHPVFMHTFPGDHDKYDALLGHNTFDGPTFQYGGIPGSATNSNNVYEKAKTWLQKSKNAGNTWVVTFTEASGGNAPKPYENVSKTQRVYWMWASAMSGGAGFEWYLKNGGAGHAYDLAVENLREFDNHWKQTGHFVKFFDQIVQRDKKIDLQDLNINNNVTSTGSDWVLADSGKAYIVFLRDGGTSNINLPDTKQYEVLWFNPRTGASHVGDTIQGAGNRPLGYAPNETNQDWAVLVTPKTSDGDSGGNTPGNGNYVEKNGLVIIEMENTQSPLGLWTKMTDINGYTGSGYLQFNGNQVESGPAKSPLTFTFTVNTSGKYHLHLRAARETVGSRTDVANDGFVKLEGDFTSGGTTPLNFLTTNTKFYGGNHMQFVWASGNRLDRDHKKWPATYNLKAGQTYTFTLSGRSKLFKVDRIMFRHDSVAKSEAEKLSHAETK